MTAATRRDHHHGWWSRSGGNTCMPTHSKGWNVQWRGETSGAKHP